jgi:RimJ/RimL family protein N-acetyltransferase
MFEVAGYRLRKPERSDVPALYRIKNDPGIAAMLVGFTTGYSTADLEAWVERHRTAPDEALLVIADREDRAIGHVGLYRIDHRVQSAEFAIVIGDRSAWGKGLGRACSRRVIEYGFDELNLRRITLEVLETNERAISLYHSLGFVDEGRLRQAYRQQGRWIDLLLMGLLIEEYRRDSAYAFVGASPR